MVLTNSYEFNFLNKNHMKKKLFGLSLVAVILCNIFSFIDISAYKQKTIVGIPPRTIRPPVKKQKSEDYDPLFIHKSTFVDTHFEG